MSKAIDDVSAERERQKSEEGWTPEHDDGHVDGELALAAACYAISDVPDIDENIFEALWPWDLKWWKPKDPRRDLVRAAALIVAEIERIDRAADKASEGQS